MNKWPHLILGAVGLSSALYGTAYAGLADVDPGPYTLATGKYPMWYEDPDGMRLELCQSKTLSSRAGSPQAPAYMCIIIPEPGVFDDLQPMVFPNNWPPELFWFLAEAQIAPPPGNDGYELEAYVAGIEAAFGLDTPSDGDQVSFARIRLRVNIPVTGTYTITHPYGVETFDVTETGRRVINMTRDIGIGAPGDYSGALLGDVGPFLRRAAGNYTETNPETGEVETFIGDPNLLETVVGSPFDTNYIEIVGPAGRLYTDVFSVSGKLYDNNLPTPVEVERSSYRRTSEGTHMEVFASAPNTSNLCYRESLELVAGTPPSPCLVNLTPDNNGQFHVRQAPSGDLPPFLVVTAAHNSGVTSPTSTSTPLVDVVKVGAARYSWADRSLHIEAVSSDEVNVPDLVAEGYGRLTRDGTAQSLTVADLAQPPAFITVKSSAGGSDREPVTVVGEAQVQEPDQTPITVFDSASTVADAGPLLIDVLANDSDPAGGTLTVVELTQPAAGQGSVTTDGTQVTYTPPAEVTLDFLASFTYRAENAQGLQSPVTTVTVSVAAPVGANPPPVAVSDSVSVTAGSAPLVINVLANDSDPEGEALSVVGLTQPAAGQGSVTTDGAQVTYTLPATVTTAFTATFTYRAQDARGAQSADTQVSVQVSPLAVGEVITVNTATVRVRRADRITWDIRGTSSLVTGNAITVEVSTPDGMALLDTAQVLANGSWRISVTNALQPSENPTATLTSSGGTVNTVPLNVQ